MASVRDGRVDPEPGLDEFSAVYAAQRVSLLRLAMVTTGSLPAAEDIVQDAFVDLYRNWSRVTDPPAWLRRAVANRSVSWLRRRLVARRYAQRAGAVETGPPPSAVDSAVRAALARLGPRQRAAVFLRYYLDLSESAIAETLGCRAGTVKSLLHRALAVLRGYLDDDV